MERKIKFATKNLNVFLLTGTRTVKIWMKSAKMFKVKGLAVWQTPSLWLMQSSYMINIHLRHQMKQALKRQGKIQVKFFCRHNFKRKFGLATHFSIKKNHVPRCFRENSFSLYSGNWKLFGAKFLHYEKKTSVSSESRLLWNYSDFITAFKKAVIC